MEIQGKTAADIFDNIRRQLLSGALQPGQALPPVRDLAVALDVNRNTVASAYKRLVAAGIAVTQGRLGTVIRAPVQPGEQEGALAGSPLTDLASGNPAPAHLPDPASFIRSGPDAIRLYGAPTVNPGLEAHAERWLGPDCPAPARIDLAHGAVDAIERLLFAHLVAGDKVAVEHPCFLGSINTLRIAGLQAVGVTTDAEGMRPDALAAALAQGAQAVLITPRAQNPLGCSLSQTRAEALQAVLAGHPDVLVIVDDHFAPLSTRPFHPVIPPATRHWALVRSVSKALGPDLRLAFVASDPDSSQRLRLRLASGTSWVSHLLQDIVQACLESDAVTEQIERARADYARRRDLLVVALQACGIAALTPADGLNVWIPLAGDSQAVVLALAQRGWLVRSGDSFGVTSGAAGIRVSIATMEADQAGRFSADLAACLPARG